MELHKVFVRIGVEGMSTRADQKVAESVLTRRNGRMAVLSARTSLCCLWWRSAIRPVLGHWRATPSPITVLAIRDVRCWQALLRSTERRDRAAHACPWTTHGL